MKKLIAKKRAAAVILAAALTLLASLQPMQIYAGTNVPVTIDISVTYIVEGNAKTAGGDKFMLSADDPASPMPAGTEAGIKTITIDDEGSFSFGDMYYDKPGVHWYTIRRGITEKKGVIKDDTVFRAKVIALNDGHGYVLVYREGSDDKEELVYTDKVAPDTGDGAAFLIWAFMALVAAVSLAGITLIREKNRKGETENER